jgi:hypothetical protein
MNNNSLVELSNILLEDIEDNKKQIELLSNEIQDLNNNRDLIITAIQAVNTNYLNLKYIFNLYLS